MVFCNVFKQKKNKEDKKCHNPYFNRWFSAIGIKTKCILDIEQVTILILIDGFLQCMKYHTPTSKRWSHNPYFNRWFSAI